MASESVTVSIPDAVIDDYRQRGVFTEVVTAKADTKYAPKLRCSNYVISLKLAYQMYEDSMDRRLNRSPEVDRGLFTEYGRLEKFLEHDANIFAMGSLAWAPGRPIRPRAWERAEREVLYDLFYPLGIPAAGSERAA